MPPPAPMPRFDPRDVDEAPCFQVRMEAGRAVASGPAHVSLGHRLPRDDAPDDGIFAAWRWDGRRLTTDADRYGLYPLYYWASADGLALSTSMFRLLRAGAPADIDWQAYAVFKACGFYPGNDTVLDAVKVVPPLGRLTWEDGRLSVVDDFVPVPPRTLTREQAVDGLIETVRQAIRRRAPEGDDFAVLLSGGRDSRHILLELCAQGRKPRFALTGRRFAPDSNHDVTIAARVAGALGVPHRIVGPGPSWIDSLVVSDVRTNMTSTRRGWKLVLAEHLEANVKASFDGIGGDMLTGRSAVDADLMRLMEDGRHDELLARMVRPKSFARSFVPAALRKELNVEAASERLRPELQRHMGAANPLISFLFWNRTRRFDGSNPYGIFRNLPTVYCPMLDHDVFDLLASLPSSLVADGRLHDEAIRRAHPKFASLAFEPDRTRRVRRPVRCVLDHLRAIQLLRAVRPRRLMDQAAAVRWLAPGALSFGLSGREWTIPGIVYTAVLAWIVEHDAFAPSSGGATP